MARYSGSGWHNQSIRHSNARKYGKAGGTYAKRYVLIGRSQGQTRILGSFKKRIDAETKENLMAFEPTDEKVEYKIKEYTPKRKAGWYDIGHKNYGKTEYNIVPRGAGWEHYPIKTGFKTEEEAREYAKKEFGSMRGVRITQSTKHYGKSELKEAYQHFSNEDLREAYIDANTQEKKRISRELHRREMPSSNQIANHFYDEDWKWFGKKFGKTPKNHTEAEQIVEDAKKERGY